MKMIDFRFFLMLLAGILALPPAAPAQWGGLEHPVEADARIAPGPGGSRETVRLVVTATIDPQYHLYAMNLTGQGPIATQINLEETPGLEPLGPWQEPPVVVKFDQGFQTEIEMLYGSPLHFVREYKVTGEVPLEKMSISGDFLHQACTETSCLPPRGLNFTATWQPDYELPAAVAERLQKPAPPAAAEQETAEPVQPPQAVQGITAATVPVGGVAEDLEAKGFLAFLITSFALGLIALITPCVFPMIPLTVSFFINKASDSKLQAVKMAGTYTLSIILCFTILGFGVALILLALGKGGEGSGFAQQMAANPWVNIFFAALYIGFALSLFGLFDIHLPSGMQAKLSSKAGGRTDIVGIFFKALVFVIISFTCTAPLVGYLIVQTIQGEWTRPLFGMMAFSAGFASPFFFLALAPHAMKTMPQSGAWLNATKVVMGLVILAASLKFISNADLVWLKENMIFTRELMLAIWTAIAAVTAFYLFGQLRLAHEDPGQKVGVIRFHLGIAFLSLALFLASGLFGKTLPVWFESYLPPDLSGAQTVVASAGNAIPPSRTETGGDHVSAGYSWFAEPEPAFAQAKELQKPVFIDFTGYTCTNCRLMEKNMFPHPRVAPLLEKFVRVKLFTDDREIGEKWQKYQAEKFGTLTLPLYAILTPEGETIAVEEYTTNVDRYVDFLKKGFSEEVAMK